MGSISGNLSQDNIHEKMQRFNCNDFLMFTLLIIKKKMSHLAIQFNKICNVLKVCGVRVYSNMWAYMWGHLWYLPQSLLYLFFLLRQGLLLNLGLSSGPDYLTRGLPRSACLCSPSKHSELSAHRAFSPTPNALIKRNS